MLGWRSLFDDKYPFFMTSITFCVLWQERKSLFDKVGRMYIFVVTQLIRVKLVYCWILTSPLEFLKGRQSRQFVVTRGCGDSHGTIMSCVNFCISKGRRTAFLSGGGKMLERLTVVSLSTPYHLNDESFDMGYHIQTFMHKSTGNTSMYFSQWIHSSLVPLPNDWKNRITHGWWRNRWRFRRIWWYCLDCSVVPLTTC